MRVELDVHDAPLDPEPITQRPERDVLLLAALAGLSATWSRYEPGERGPGPHVHRRHTDAFYVLEGELECRVGPGAKTVVRAPAGTFVAVPPHVVHTFANAGAGEARFLKGHGR